MQLSELKDWVVTQLDDLKAKDIKVLDVRALTSITDMMVICTGTSSRHVLSIADHLWQESKKQHIHLLGIEGTDAAEWVLVDLNDVVVHIMQQSTRDLYQLEKLWQVRVPDENAATLPHE